MPTSVVPAAWGHVELAHAPHTRAAARHQRAHKPPAPPAIVGRRRHKRDPIVIGHRIAAPGRDGVLEAYAAQLALSIDLIADARGALARGAIRPYLDTPAPSIRRDHTLAHPAVDIKGSAFLYRRGLAMPAPAG